MHSSTQLLQTCFVHLLSYSVCKPLYHATGSERNIMGDSAAASCMHAYATGVHCSSLQLAYGTRMFHAHKQQSVTIESMAPVVQSHVCTLDSWLKISLGRERTAELSNKERVTSDK